MELVSWGQSDAGRERSQNEDAMVMDPILGFYLIADGRGSEETGYLASKVAADTIYARLRTLLGDGVINQPEQARDRLVRRLPAVFTEVSEAIYQRARMEGQRSGVSTTATLLQVVGSIGVIGHVGNSRVYLCRGDTTYQVTEDHTLVQQLARSGQLRPEEVANFPHQKALNRTLGSAPAVETDTLVVDVAPGDRIVLCSDGLSDFVSAAEIQRTVTAVPPETAVRSLVRSACERGGEDDVSLVVIEATGGTDPVHSLRTEQKAALLGRIFLFSDLSFQEIVRVLAAVQEVRVRTGMSLTKEGDSGDLIYFLAEGEANVTRSGVQVGTIRAGDHFGEMALLGDGTRSATVTASKDAILLTLHRDDFYHLVQTDHGLAIKLLWGFLTNLAGTVKNLSDELTVLHGGTEPKSVP